MAHGQSGRIVVDVQPEAKRRLYAALSMSGTTLKDWFIQSANDYCEAQLQPSLLPVKASKIGETAPDYNRADNKRFSMVSMFSGCGGMDLGFIGGFQIFGREYAKHPIDIVWANDLNPAACETYRRNIGTEIYTGDIWSLIDTMPKKADILVGGFPCQDISINGKMAGINGPRSGLYRAMIEAIKRLKPKVFVAENVRALFKHPEWLDQIVKDFGSLGYNLKYDLYRAADYGVPQTRERVFFVGTLPELKEFTPPSPERDATNWMSAKEAIDDLSKLPIDREFSHMWSMAARSGEQGGRKLIAGRPGYTIRAECHGNIQFHYHEKRRISMREAARIQTFPDNFRFASGLRETERQVGNAVPPVLAWHIANAVLKSLQRPDKKSS